MFATDGENHTTNLGLEKGLNGFVYVIRHKGCGKEYVGLTIRKPTIRWAQHVKAATVDGSVLEVHKALRVDGVDNFAFEILWEGSVCEICAQEAKFIRDRKTEAPFGYNMCPGGRGAPLRTLQTRAMLRTGVEDILKDRLVLSATSAEFFKRNRRGGDYCKLSLAEATRLLDWQVTPVCKAHHHISRAKLDIGHYKILETADGEQTRLAVSLTEFYKVVEWGWSMQSRSNGLG